MFIFGGAISYTRFGVVDFAAYGTATIATSDPVEQSTAPGQFSVNRQFSSYSGNQSDNVRLNRHSKVHRLLSLSFQTCIFYALTVIFYATVSLRRHIQRDARPK